MPGRIVRNTSQGQLVPLLFGQDQLAAGQTDVQLAVPMAEATQVNDGYVMPFPWEVVAISGQFSTAVTGGSIAIGATLDGTEDADTTVTLTSGTTFRQSVARAKMGGPAGSVIGVEITTAAGFTPITADLAVTVWVLVYLQGV